jgi:phosphatidylglycerophosphatase A
MSLFAQIATAFGIGRVPQAPGTVASAAAILIAIPVVWLTGSLGLLALTVIATAAGVWASDHYAVESGIVDPKDCVIDEFAGQWLAVVIVALAAVPGEPKVSWMGYLLAFALFRLFDIAKPWPVNKCEELPGGLGIMADDLAAGAMAGFVTFLVAFSGFI